jgi:hypothetical protein
MSSPTHHLGDAVRSDGTLKDASEMTWYHDTDESIPFPLSSAPGSHTIPSMPAPAMMVHGAHQTGHIHHPLQHALEAAEASSSMHDGRQSGIKCKASSDCLDDRGPRRRGVEVVNMDITNVDDNNASDGESRPPTEPTSDSESQPPTEPTSNNNYEALRAMANTDNVVRCLLPHFELSHSFSGCNLQIPGGAHG